MAETLQLKGKILKKKKAKILYFAFRVLIFTNILSMEELTQ